MGHRTFRYIAPRSVEIGGLPAEGMTVRASSGRVLGELRGIVVDETHEHIRYIALRPTGAGKTTLLPFTTPRVDLEERAIEVDVDDQQLWQLRNFSPDHLLIA